MIIDAKIKTEPRAWKVSKVNRVATKGVVIVTLAQDRFDQNKDYIELNEDGNVIGMWADYYTNGIVPEDYNSEKPIVNIYSKIIHTGTKSELKVGGSAKTFTVKYYQGEEEIPAEIGNWTFMINDIDITSDYSQYLEITTIDVYQIKVKFVGDRTNIEKVLSMKYTSTNSEATIDVAIVGL